MTKWTILHHQREATGVSKGFSIAVVNLHLGLLEQPLYNVKNHKNGIQATYTSLDSEVFLYK